MKKNDVFIVFFSFKMLNQTFKIYDDLIKQVSDSSSIILSNEYRATLNTLAPEHREIIYAMILHHYQVTGNNLNEKMIPYKGKLGQGGKGVTFDTLNLPTTLQKIIVLYLEKIKSISI